MTPKYGIEVFEILDNGNLLNAVYTDSHSIYQGQHYVMFCETATKINPDDKGIEGKFNCKYIEMGIATVEYCTLTITKKGSAYKFEWRKDGLISEGIGLMTNSNHIAVSYIEINQN